MLDVCLFDLAVGRCGCSCGPFWSYRKFMGRFGPWDVLVHETFWSLGRFGRFTSHLLVAFLQLNSADKNPPFWNSVLTAVATA